MYARYNDGQTAISLWNQTTLPSSRSLYVSLLTACGNTMNAPLAGTIHQKLFRDGFELDSPCNCFNQHVCELGDKEQALEIWDYMNSNGINGNSVTYICLLSLASSTKDIQLGQNIYNSITLSDSLQNASVYTAIIKMYASCENPQL